MAATNVLSRPISVYSIPPPLLDALTVRSIQAQAVPQQTSTEAQQPEPVPEEEPTTTASTGLGCQTCPGASFDTPEDQRAHFKSDWHRYNAKAKVGGQKIVTADEWENMVEGESRSRVRRLTNRRFQYFWLGLFCFHEQLAIKNYEALEEDADQGHRQERR